MRLEVTLRTLPILFSVKSAVKQKENHFRFSSFCSLIYLQDDNIRSITEVHYTKIK
jgi:hypothetical protein